MAKDEAGQQDIDLRQFIGRSVDDPDLQAFIRQIEGEPETFNMTIEGPDKRAIRLLELGLQVAADEDKKINTIFVFAAGVQGYQAYPYALPNGLSFDLGREAAIAILGPPTKTGGPVEGVLDGKIFFWDRWDNDAFSLHLRYPEDKNSIAMLTLIRPDRLPD